MSGSCRGIAWRTLVLAILTACPAIAYDNHVLVLTADQSAGVGNCTALAIEPPWTGMINLEAVDSRAVVRFFFGKHYVVNVLSGEIQVVDPVSFDTVSRFSVGADSSPRDIVLLNQSTAYVSRYDSNLLFKVDPTTGALLATVDLGGLADPDGLPEMAMMALDGSHLFVQVQRVDRDSFQPVAPSYLAVIDVTTDELIDANPILPGVQGIALAGLIPDLKMQVESERRRLYVSAPGLWHDSAGGIDEIDLDTLESLGFAVTEHEIALQMGPFVMVSGEKGYVITHTDIALSSHLSAFSRPDGSPVANPFNTLSVKIESLAFDPVTSQLFIPDGNFDTGGVVVIDTVSDTLLTANPIGTGLPPFDLVVARGNLVLFEDGFESGNTGAWSWAIP